MASINLVERLDYITPVQLPQLFVLQGTIENVVIEVLRVTGTNNYTVTVVSAGKAVFPIISYNVDPLTGLKSPVYATQATLLIYVNTNLATTVEIQQSDIASLTPEANVAAEIYAQFSSSGWGTLLAGNLVTFGFLTPFDPTIEIHPLDTQFIAPTADSQDQLTQDTIRSQQDYVVLDDPYFLLHSTMRNPFYAAFTAAYTKQLQYTVDAVNPLKTLYDIDYYDGDQDSFLEKISNLAVMFGFSIPQTFLSRTNVENGDMQDVNRQNDFLRNVVKRMWLGRRWAGTLIGYKLPLKWINRIGAIHLAMLYPDTQNITTTTGKIYRLLDDNNLALLIPGSPGTAYPLSANLVGASSVGKATKFNYRWDTGNTWDQSITVQLVLSPGSTGITFSSVTYNQVSSPKTATFTVVSVLNATQGSIVVAGTQIFISTTDLQSGTLGIASKIGSTFIDGWTSLVVGATVVLSYTQNSALQWDLLIPSVISGRSLMMEIALDRILHHTNSVGTQESLMDTGFHEALATLVQTIQRAQDVLYIGSQMTLVTSNDGYFNTMPFDAVTNPHPQYTHDNIKARFQVFKFLPDKMTQAWTGGLSVQYIKIGNGGYGEAFVDNQVFVNRTSAPDAPNQVVLSDLRSPLFKTVIGANERNQYGPYYLLNVVVHPRTIAGTNNLTVTMNGVNTPSQFFQNAIIPLINDYISNGTVTVGINIVYAVPNLTYSAALHVTLGPPMLVVTGTWSITVVAVTGTTGAVTIMGQTVLLGAADMVSTQTVAAKIASVQNFGDYTASATGNVVTFIARMASLSQRIFIYEAYNSLKNSYDALYKYQEIGDDFEYHDFQDTASLYGYTQDTSYAGLDSLYLPTVQRNAVILAPLNIEDQFPTLFQGAVLMITLNEGVTTPLTDHSFDYNNQVLFRNDGTSANTTVVPAGAPAGQGPQGNALTFNGTTSYVSVSPSDSLNTLAAWTYSLFFQCTGSNVSQSFLFSKTNPLGTAGYSAYFTSVNTLGIMNAGFWNDSGAWGDSGVWTDIGTSTAGAAYLTIAANILIAPSTTAVTQTWSLPVSVDADWHQLTIAFDWEHIPSVYVDGVPQSVGGTLTPVGNGVTQTEDNLDPVVFGSGIGGLAGSNIDVIDPTTGLWTDFSNWIDTGAWSDTSSSFIGILDSIGAWEDAGAWQDGGTWTEIASATSFLGRLSEFRIYNRVLSAIEVEELYTAVTNRGEPLLTSNGEQRYVSIDHLNGLVILKPQYNVNGPLAAFTTSQQDYSGLITQASESYRTGESLGITPISEMGLFDVNDTLVAYATFPPVIYNPNLFHLAFNILITI